MKSVRLLRAAAGALILSLGAISAPVLADETADEGYDVIVDLGAGARVQPRYEGSGDYEVVPVPLVNLSYVSLGRLQIDERDIRIWSVRPAFRWRGEREESDLLPGFGDVDAAYEFGAAVAYRRGIWRAFAELRRGFGGHEGLVGEVGVDAISQPTPRLDIAIGPRLTFASKDYMQTYFGVTPLQAAATGIAPFDADAGVKSLGVETSLRYALNEDWFVVGKAGYFGLLGDAAASPVVDLGSSAQATATIGLSRRLRFRF